MLEYFTDLLSESHVLWEHVVQCITTTITQLQNGELMQPIIKVEVRSALFQMHPDKSHGPDKMTLGFFQKHWRIVRKDVVDMVVKFFIDGIMPNSLNATNLVLIPKKKFPTNMTELHPISLCNVLVKIITKVLANRMKAVLNSIISENQSAFIQGRLISDNVMISYEIMHYLIRKKEG